MINEKTFLKDLKVGTMETTNKGLKNKIPEKRWRIAQDSEKEFWETYSKDDIIGDFEGKSKILFKELSRFIILNKNTKILQIGCGPKDVINYFPLAKRYSIDPLGDFYREKFDFDYESSHLQKGIGEEIPFRDNYFDVVILSNVLDHVHLPDKVIQEIYRALKKGGVFFFENFVYQKRFIQLAKIWGKLKEIFLGEIFNIHHPYMFTVKDIQNLLLKKFSILNEEIGTNFLEGIKSFKNLKQKKRDSKKLTIKIPAIFNLYGIINYAIICKK